MAVILGLAAALVYGAADFMGGLSARRSSPYAVVVWSQMIGLVALLAWVAVTRSPVAESSDLMWGAVGGIGAGAGVVLLYRGLSIGRMAVVAPTTAVGAAAIPLVVGLLRGERPPALALIGVVVAIAAIVLVSSADAPDAGEATPGWPPGLKEAIGSGLGFALFFVCLANAGDDAGLWPLLAARVSIGVAVAGALLTRASLRPAPGSLPLIGVTGVLDMGANLLYLLATRYGLLSLVAVLVSLYPASTVVLARVVLHERLAARQIVGLLAAGAGVALIAA